MYDYEISIVFITTVMFNAIVDTDIESLMEVRKILFGGEKVSYEHVERLLKVIGPNKIIHVYGPTENTVFSTFHPVNKINS